MATRGTIAVQHADGTVSQIYTHWDSYLDYNGRLLHTMFNTQERAEALVALGDVSSLAPSIDAPAGHSYDNPHDGCTVFYGRDRGETGVEARKFSNFRLYVMGFDRQDYNYLFKDGKWFVSYYQTGDDFVSLESAFADEEALED